MRGVNPRPLSKIREDLFRLAETPTDQWAKKSYKKRMDAFVKACGLEATFTPKCVYETIFEDGGKRKSVFTGRDGRILWVSERGTYYAPAGTGKFSSPWSKIMGRDRIKAKRFSYLASVCADYGIPKGSIKSMVRLSAQFWLLSKNSFNGIMRKILSYFPKIERRIPKTSVWGIKPYLTGKEVKSKHPSLATVPLWNWRVYDSYGIAQATEL